MGKVIDITEKLTFDSNPQMIIKGKKIEVKSDAPTMLKVMALLGGEGDPQIKEILEVYTMMFPEASQKEIEKLGLDFKDLVIVIQEAVSLITGDTARGE